MTDFHELMQILSASRPNGSQAERETLKALCNWLDRRTIPFRQHTFRLYPYFMEANGAWLILSRTLLAVAIWQRWGWAAAIISVLGLLGGALDVAKGWPLVTWMGWRQGTNLLVEYKTPAAQQHIILSAHYDSKTELLDHKHRAFLTRHLRFGLLLTLILGLMGPLDTYLMARGLATDAICWLAIGLCLPLLFLAWGLGLNLLLGRAVEPSQGAVDDGASCAVLLALSERLMTGEIPITRSNVTLVLFTGEEVNMQGSKAFVRDYSFSLPATVLVLELLGQNGPYVLWENDGNAFGRVPTSKRISEQVEAAVLQVTGEPIDREDIINSDCYTFLSAGMPTTTFGNKDRVLGLTGMHRPADHLGRVDLDRLPQCVQILEHFLRGVDQSPSSPHSGSPPPKAIESQ